MSADHSVSGGGDGSFKPAPSGGIGLFISRLQSRVAGDQRFARLALRIPFLRPLVRRQTKGLFDLMAGFVYSQVLDATLRLGVFDYLADDALTLAELSALTGLDPEPLRVLLRAAASLNLVKELSGQRYAIALRGSILMSDAGLAAMVRHHRLFYQDLGDLGAVLRREKQTEMSRYWAYGDDDRRAAMPDALVKDYSALMASSGEMVRDEVFAACRFDRVNALLDVGGGEGAFLQRLGQQNKAVKLSLLDLAPVVARASSRLQRAGLADRFSGHGGDFTSDPIPPGADMITLIRVLHDHDDSTVHSLLSRVFSALPSGGRLLIAEPMVAPSKREAVTDCYFALYMLTMGKGRLRSPHEIAEMLSKAGFTKPVVRRSRQPLLVQVLEAQRP